MKSQKCVVSYYTLLTGSNNQFWNNKSDFSLIRTRFTSLAYLLEIYFFRLSQSNWLKQSWFVVSELVVRSGEKYMIRLGNFFAENELEIVMNELRRFKHSADFFANSSHIIESAAISFSQVSTPLTHLHWETII